MIEPYRPVGPQAVTARVAAIVLVVAARTHPSMTEVAQMVGLPVSTTHRLLGGLVAGRLVKRTAQGRYQLDPAALPTWSGSAALRAHITAAVVDLADITGLHVRFGATVRLRGVATAQAEWRTNERAVAAPVFGPNGVVAALEIVGTGFSPNVKGQTAVLLYAARALGRRLADQPSLLPSGTGTTPLRWPVDPTSSASVDDTDARSGGATPHAWQQDGAHIGSEFRPAGSPSRTRPPAARAD